SHAGAGWIDSAATRRAVRASAAHEVGRDHVDRRISRHRGPRALDFRLVIAGCERLAVADPHPVEIVAEKGGRLLRRDADRLSAKRRPILPLGETRLILPMQ